MGIRALGGDDGVTGLGPEKTASASALEASLRGRVTEALQRLSAHVDVSGVKLCVTQDAIEIVRMEHKLTLLPAAADGGLPSVSRVAAELATFLLPVPEEVMRRIANDLGDAASGFLDPLVEVSRIDPTLIIDSRYATADNCAKRALYPPQMRTRCFVRQSMATQLHRVQTTLHRQGYGLKIWDGYRPQAIQWRCADPEVIPDAATRRLFVPPTQGSNHARGCAVDLTLVHRETGHECLMPTGFDSPAPEAASDATDGLSREPMENRQRLHAAMTEAGFVPLPHEWWHFNFRPDGNTDRSRNAGDLYLVLDIPFEALLAAGEPAALTGRSHHSKRGGLLL